MMWPTIKAFSRLQHLCDCQLWTTGNDVTDVKAMTKIKLVSLCLFHERKSVIESLHCKRLGEAFIIRDATDCKDDLFKRDEAQREFAQGTRRRKTADSYFILVCLFVCLFVLDGTRRRRRRFSRWKLWQSIRDGVPHAIETRARRCHPFNYRQHLFCTAQFFSFFFCIFFFWSCTTR